MTGEDQEERGVRVLPDPCWRLDLHDQPYSLWGDYVDHYPTARAALAAADDLCAPRPVRLVWLATPCTIVTCTGCGTSVAGDGWDIHLPPREVAALPLDRWLLIGHTAWCPACEPRGELPPTVLAGQLTVPCMTP